MLRRYNVVDERDLAEAAERLSGFLTDAARTALQSYPSPPLAGAAMKGRSQRMQTEYGQFGGFTGCAGRSGSRK